MAKGQYERQAFSDAGRKMLANDVSCWRLKEGRMIESRWLKE
jgi:hypothetical protein